MSIKDELKAITNEYAKNYKEICEASRDDYMKSLNPGSPTPARDVLYGDEARAKFGKKADSHRAKAIMIIGNELRSLNEKMSAAPSTEAVNALKVLKMRKTVKADEVESLMMRYGDNSLVHDTLCEIAAEHDIGKYAYADNPLRVKAEKLNDLRHSITNNLNLASAEKGHASDGFIAFLNATIDDALPDE